MPPLKQTTMKKKILLLMGIFSIGIITYAQVGINTKNPIGIFHVDPKGDTNTSGSVGITDDLIIDKSGNIGVGVLPRTDAKINLTDGGTAASVKFANFLVLFLRKIYKYAAGRVLNR